VLSPFSPMITFTAHAIRADSRSVGRRFDSRSSRRASRSRTIICLSHALITSTIRPAFDRCDSTAATFVELESQSNVNRIVSGRSPIVDAEVDAEAVRIGSQSDKFTDGAWVLPSRVVIGPVVRLE